MSVFHRSRGGLLARLGILKTINGRPILGEGATVCVRMHVMIRFVVIAIVVVAVWALLVKLIKALKSANIDWTGVTTIVGFIALAFWLRHVTGMG